MYLVGFKHGDFIQLSSKQEVKSYIVDMLDDGYSKEDILVYKGENVPFEVVVESVEVVL